MGGEGETQIRAQNKTNRRALTFPRVMVKPEPRRRCAFSYPNSYPSNWKFAQGILAYQNTRKSCRTFTITDL